MSCIHRESLDNSLSALISSESARTVHVWLSADIQCTCYYHIRYIAVVVGVSSLFSLSTELLRNLSAIELRYITTVQYHVHVHCICTCTYIVYMYM